MAAPTAVLKSVIKFAMVKWLIDNAQTGRAIDEDVVKFRHSLVKKDGMQYPLPEHGLCQQHLYGRQVNI